MCCMLYGLVDTYSVFQPYVAEHFGLAAQSALLPYTSVMAFLTLGQFVVVALRKRLQSKPIAAIGLTMVLGGYLACSAVPSEAFPAFAVAYSVVMGSGIGIVFNLCTSTVMQWYPDKKGFAAGVSLSMTGTSTAVCSPLFSNALAHFGLAGTYRIVAVCALVFALFIILIIKAPPEGYMADFKPEGKLAEQTAQRECTSVGEVLRTRDYYLVSGMFFSGVPGWVLTCGSFVTIGILDKGLTQPEGALFLSAAAIAQVIGRFLVGTVSDHIGRKTVMISCALGMAAAIALFVFATGFVYAAALSVFAFFYGGSVTTMPPIITDRLGVKNASTHIAMAELGPLVGSVLASVLLGALSMHGLMTVAATCALSGIAFTLLLYQKRA